MDIHGYTKKLRQNGTIPGFSASFIKKIIDNPVYMGKIAYGRRRTEKKTGTRNETHVVEQSDFPVYEGVHEAIIAEEDWKLAQEKRSKNNYKREKIHDPEHAHILSGILKYGNRNPTGFRRWVKVAESGGLCYTCVMGTWKSKTRHKYLLQYHIIFVCKYRKKLLMSKQISDDIIGQSILFGRMDILPAV